MRGELLLDTGALVSLLDRSQTHHLKCRRAFADWTGPVVSTEAVLTEATHLLAGVQGGRAACVDFFLSGGALLVPSSTTSLQRVRKLLDKYADLPMDFADATPCRARQSPTSVSQTAPNGSGRVRQSRGCLVADGAGPVSHSRAVRRLMPQAAAAAA